MTGLDRRDVIKGMMLATGSVVLPWQLNAAERVPGLFVYDGRIAAAALRADSLRAAGVPVIDREQTDLGQAWRDTIPRHIATGAGPVTGMTLWVDSFICETFAREKGLAIRRIAVPGGKGVQQWSLV